MASNSNETTSELIHSPFMRSFHASEYESSKLREYLAQYVVSNDDTTTKVNFINMDPDDRKRYNVPDDAIPVLMENIKSCTDSYIQLQLLECQDVNDKCISGLFFDFEFESDLQKIDFQTVVPGFTKHVFDVIARYINIESGKSTHYAFYFATNNPMLTVDRKYKSKFRISIPSFQMDTNTRFFLYYRLWQSKCLKDIFEDKLQYSFRACFQRDMLMAPVSMHGCFIYGELTQPMTLTMITQIIFEIGAKGIGYEAIPLSDQSKFKNLPYETSIGYAMENSVVEKKQYLLNTAGFARLRKDLEDPQVYFTREYCTAKANFVMKSVCDNDIMNSHHITHTYNIIRDILDETRFHKLDSWLDVIRSIAACDRDYECLAILITQEKAQKLIEDGDKRRPLTWDEFSQYWAEARKSDVKSRYSFKSIRFWASDDNPSKLEYYIEKEIKTMIQMDITHSVYKGKMASYNFAKYIKFMFGDVYMTQAINAACSSHTWYEFVTPSTRDSEKGEIFKWRDIGQMPDSLSVFMSTKLQAIVEDIHKSMDAWINKAIRIFDKADPRIDHMKNLKSQFSKYLLWCREPKQKYSIIKETAGFLKDELTIKKFDKDENIIGVGNGVIEFSMAEGMKHNFKLLDHFHQYAITLYTDTPYMPYDENNHYIKTMWSMLKSLVPDNELDALDFLLYYFSTSLDWLKKESLFLIIHGGGCHAIDTPIRMFDGSIKMVQDVEVGDKLMGDDNTSRQVQELFRGTDEMYRILPKKGESFEVNKDHVLSLRFSNDFAMHNICSKLDIDYCNVLDIKVCELLRYGWHIYGDVLLHKADGSTYEFSIEPIGQGDYYGFELDGNHRYLDGNFYVHHNSNGKSVILELLRRTLGESYARKLPLSFITDQSRTKASSADPTMMELKNARLAYYSESDQNERVNIAKIKEITGGETLSGRALFKGQENFKANCNHIVTTNHRFVIETNEHAVWRRFISYKMKIRFIDNCTEKHDRPRDPALINKIMSGKEYHAAFMSILLQYRTKLWREYNGEILKVPRPTIINETDEYRSKGDIYERFILKRVVYQKGVSPQMMDKFVDLFISYQRAEYNSAFKTDKEDAIHIFRNSSIAKFVREGENGYEIRDLRALDTEELLENGSGVVLFKNWRNANN
jgi:phage/plasmid-associated DNA primase